MQQIRLRKKRSRGGKVQKAQGCLLQIERRAYRFDQKGTSLILKKKERLCIVFSASATLTSLIVRKKAELDKELGGITILREQSERRSLKAEERLQELLQGQTSAEQEAQRVTQARQDLDDVRKKLDNVQTENLVSKKK